MTNTQENFIDQLVTELCGNGYNAEAYEVLGLKAKSQTGFFLPNFRPNDAVADAKVETWLENSENQELLAEFVGDLQDFVAKTRDRALPAHDERQISFKDAAEALRFYQMEGLTGLKATGVIPATFHDVGRFVEGAWYHPTKNPHDHWILHAQLSFLVFQKILASPQYQGMPNRLKDHYLYAVLVHSGQNGATFMSRMTQACDRMQLIGAEGLFRGLAYGVCLMGGKIAYPEGEKFSRDLPNYGEHASVLMELEFFARNMLENIGEKHAVHRREMAVQNVALLKLLCQYDPNLEGRMFAPEVDRSGDYGRLKKGIPDDIWKAAQDLADTWENESLDDGPPLLEVADSLCLMLTEPTGTAPLSEEMRARISEAVRSLKGQEVMALYRIALKAQDLRDQGDEQDMKLVRAVLVDESTPVFIRLIARVCAGDIKTNEKNLCLPDLRALPIPSLG
ncbi:MAG: hypothetical protein JNL76_02580 [Alphaproteobacteria bacterium]|nr:hypothetical protein [Alphaproteobacteria bacterium]